MKSLKGIALTVIFFVGIIWFRSANRQHQSDASIELAISIVESVPEYEQNRIFFASKLAEFHERAFGMAYKRGRFKSSFGENIYRTVLLVNLWMMPKRLETPN